MPMLPLLHPIWIMRMILTIADSAVTPMRLPLLHLVVHDQILQTMNPADTIGMMTHPISPSTSKSDEAHAKAVPIAMSDAAMSNITSHHPSA